MEVGNAMAEEEGLKPGIVLMPMTPAKPMPQRPELCNSTNRGVSCDFLGMSDLDINLHVGIDSSSMLLCDHANNGLNGPDGLDKRVESSIDLNRNVSDMEFEVSRSVCLHQYGGSSGGEACNASAVVGSFGSIDLGDLRTTGVSSPQLMASDDDARPACGQVSGRATLEGVEDSSAGLRLYENNSKIEAPHVGGVDNKFSHGNSLRCPGLSSASVSTPTEKPSPRKRGNDGIDMNKKLRKRPKMKRHRPKILDESKPRKIPRSQTAKSSSSKPRNTLRSQTAKNSFSDPNGPGTASREKRKYVRRSSLKASVNSLEEVEGQAVKTTTYPRAEGEGTLRRSSVLETGELSALNPWTPEPSIPKRAIFMESPFGRREHVTKDTPESLVNLSEKNYGQQINEPRLGAKSCRRALNFSFEDQMQNEILYQNQSQNKGGEKSPFKWDFSLNLQVQDFDVCAELKRIVNQYRCGKRRRGRRSLNKSQSKCSANLNSRTRKLNSCNGMKNKSDDGISPLSNVVKEMMAGPVNGGKVTTYQNPGPTNQIGSRFNSLKVYQRTFRCLKISTKLGPNFPKLCKKKRSKRRRIANCARLQNDLMIRSRRKRSIRMALKRSLTVGLNFPKTWKKKRSKRRRIENCAWSWNDMRSIMSAPKDSSTNKPSKSHGEQEKDLPIIGQELYNTSEPFSCVVAEKKNSKSFIKRHSNQLASTSVLETFTIRSQGVNEHESEACGGFRQVNDQNLLRNIGYHADHSVIDHKRIESDPPERKDRLLELPGEKQGFMLNNMQYPILQEHMASNHDIGTCSSKCNGFFQISSNYHLQQENVASNNDTEACFPMCNHILQIPSAENDILKIWCDPVQQENVTYNNIIEAFSSEIYHASQNSFVENASQALADYVIQELEPLAINDCSQLVVRDQDSSGALVPYEGKSDPSKKKKTQVKVDLDPETMRKWRALMENEGSEVREEVDVEREKWWEEQRKIFRLRINALLGRMHEIQGNRQFSPWKGSVVDSVVGAFLTQNVSDHLSSSAFMSLRAQYPPKCRSNQVDGDKDNTSMDVSISSTETQANDAKDEHSHVFQTQQNVDIRCAKSIKSIEDNITYTAASGSVEDGIGDDASKQNHFACSSDSNTAASAGLDAFRQTLESEENNFLQNFNSCQKGEENSYVCQSQQNIDIHRVKSIEDNMVYAAASDLVEDGIGENASQRINFACSCDKNESAPAFSLLEVPELFGETQQSEENNFLQNFNGCQKGEEHSYVFQNQQNIDIYCCKSIEDNIAYAAASGLMEDGIGCNGSQQINFACSSDSNGAAPAFSLLERSNELRETQQPEEHNFLQNFNSCQKGEEHSCVFQSQQHIDIHGAKRIEENIVYAAAPGLVEDEIGDNASQQTDIASSSDSNGATPAFSLPERPDAFRETQQSEAHYFNSHQKGEIPCDFEKRVSLSLSSGRGTSPKDYHDSSINYDEISQSERKSRRKSGKIEENLKDPIDWDQLRKTYSSCKPRDANGNTLDSVDWEAVRRATVKEVADVIAVRGQHRVIAGRIKEFLERLVKDHGSIDLEWLRDVPPDKAKEYLLSINGLGLKSVECIRLLELHCMAFPVDTNVGRVAVRLGWVPLQPLPEDVQIHLLNQYPLMDAVQKYLWPRLCTLDQPTLYELHYQLITFGKVFCTKRNPNCNACPMRAECRHFASAFASARLRLPGPQQKGIVTSRTPIAADQEATLHTTPAILSLPDGSFPGSGHRTLECEPIVEFPKSPEPEPEEIPIRDIEDFCYDSGDEIPVIKLNNEVFKENLLHFVEESFLSQALVPLTVEAASIPMPKLKDVSRLRTEHQVYELPDSHPLLARLEKREADDPCPYLLAISPDESSNSSEQSREPYESEPHELPTTSPGSSSRGQNPHKVRGTIFVPCRTAEKGSFPLNGTYFQVNEVFADHESSQRQINVPRSWLCDLRKRTLYCGTSATSIFKGMSMEEIQYCFWRGFICVRGFDRETGDVKPLSERFHVSSTMAWKKKKAQRKGE